MLYCGSCEKDLERKRESFLSEYPLTLIDLNSAKVNKDFVKVFS